MFWGADSRLAPRKWPRIARVGGSRRPSPYCAGRPCRTASPSRRISEAHHQSAKLQAVERAEESFRSLQTPTPGSQRRAFSRKIFRKTLDRAAPAPASACRSYSILSSPEKNSQSRSCVACSARAAAAGIAVAVGEVGGVEDPVLVAGQELPDPLAVAAGEVTDPGGGVDREVGIGVEALRQPLEVVLVAAQVAPDHAQLGIAGQHPVAGRQDRRPCPVRRPCRTCATGDSSSSRASPGSCRRAAARPRSVRRGGRSSVLPACWIAS